MVGTGGVPCSSCGTTNAAGAKFCSECGNPLAAGCPSCGATNPPGAKFCNACGTSLTGTPPSAPAEERGAPSAAERRVVSVLFADLVGFTPMSEERDPEETRELLSRQITLVRTLADDSAEVRRAAEDARAILTELGATPLLRYVEIPVRPDQTTASTTSVAIRPAADEARAR